MNTPSTFKLSWPVLIAIGTGAACGLLTLLGRGHGFQSNDGIGYWGLLAAPIFFGIFGTLSRPETPLLTAYKLMLICFGVAAPLMGEGVVCFLYLLPIAVVTCAASVGVTWLLRQGWLLLFPKSTTPLVALLALPFGAAAYARLHPPDLADPVLLTSSVVVDQPREAVWRSLEELRLDFADDGPWYFRALPVPRAIRGGGTFVGAIRRVVFDNGTVVATVTRSNPPEGFDVSLSVENPGREFFEHWALLEQSHFRFEPLAGGRTRIVHSTSYRPRLTVRWYSEPFERLLGELLQARMLEAYAAVIRSEPYIADRR